MKKIVTAYVFLCISLVLLGFFVGVEKVQEKPSLAIFSPHVYDDPKVSIKEIHITVFYFVPKDKVLLKQENWKVFTEEHIKKLQEFHDVQFLSSSKISYTFFPEIITGDQSSKYYEIPRDDESPDDLIPIKQEINNKVFAEDGVMHNVLNSLAEHGASPNTKRVYLVVYEGEGGSANDDYALIGRTYLTDSIYKETGSTYLAHEFYHTLLLPDNYKKSAYVYDDGKDTTISLISNKDIMGRVDIPLTYTYIDNETLKKMGL